MLVDRNDRIIDFIFLTLELPAFYYIYIIYFIFIIYLIYFILFHFIPFAYLFIHILL